MKTKFYFLIILFSLFFAVYEDAQAQAPNFTWTKAIGGTGYDHGWSIAVDASGNFYATGGFSDTVDFDPGPGTYNLVANGNVDIFIAKFNISGNLTWVKQIGNAMESDSRAIAVDASGNVYTTGLYEAVTDFDPGPGTYNLDFMGFANIFVCKLDSAGNFVWARGMVGGNFSIDQGYSIAVDTSGNVFTTGIFSQTADFDPGPGTFNLTTFGGNDVFISKLNSSGNLVWVKQIGSTGNDYGRALALDSAGNIYTTGHFQGTADFDPGAGVFNLTSAGGDDVFVSKLNNAGNFVWANRMGSVDDEWAWSVAFDKSWNVYTTGFFSDTTDFDPGAGTYNLIPEGNRDLFISKTDSMGNFIMATSIGGTNSSINAIDIAVDATGDIYTVGSFTGTIDFNPGAGTFNLTSDSAGWGDMFFSKLDSLGNFAWARSAQGTMSDLCSSVTPDAYGNVYFTGFWDSPSLTLDSQNFTNGGGRDFFISKLSSCVPTTSAISPVACGYYISPSGNYNWTSPGIYTDTITNAAGCDSIITVNLTINPLPVALYTLYPDTTTPHNWFALNQCMGTPPLNYVWNWGDSTATSTGATPTHVYADSGYYNICVEVTDGNGCLNTYCDSSTYIYKGNGNSIITLSVVTQLPTGINELNGNNNGVSVYPNPAEDYITITGNALQKSSVIKIVDLMGKEVYNGIVTTQKLEVNTKDFSNGIYFVQIQTPDFIETKKLIVAK